METDKGYVITGPQNIKQSTSKASQVTKQGIHGPSLPLPTNTQTRVTLGRTLQKRTNTLGRERREKEHHGNQNLGDMILQFIYC